MQHPPFWDMERVLWQASWDGWLLRNSRTFRSIEWIWEEVWDNISLLGLTPVCRLLFLRIFVIIGEVLLFWIEVSFLIGITLFPLDSFFSMPCILMFLHESLVSHEKKIFW